jgi:hypothetical protein
MDQVRHGRGGFQQPIQGVGCVVHPALVQRLENVMQLLGQIQESIAVIGWAIGDRGGIEGQEARNHLAR